MAWSDMLRVPFNSTAPTYPEWLWLVQPEMLVGQAAVYMAVMLGLKQFMKDREPFKCYHAMLVYNAFQVALCYYMTHGLFWNLVENIQEPWLELIPGVVSIPNVYGISNAPSANGEYYLYIHYFSKAVDYFDTLFIVLKKKDRQFSFLHIWHHSTIGPIWGFLLFNSIHGGTACFGALLNSWIHVLMYSHYFFTALGFKNPLKKLLTMAQITQFYACFSHAGLGLVYETVFPRPLAWVQFFYQLSMLYLFTAFSNRTYAEKPAAAAGKEVEAESSADSPSPAKGPVTRRRAKMKATTD